MAYLSPIGNEQQSDSNGAPLSGGRIWTYAAGTSTLATTYTGEDGVTPQANPIILNSSGLPANPIWLQGGTAYKFVITNSSDVVQRTVDDIQGINDPSFSAAVDEWVLFAGAPSYISATSFSVVGDQSNTFQAARRVKSSNTGGTVYSTIISASFGAGITTVTVVNDSGSLDAGLSAVFPGLLSATSPSVPQSYCRINTARVDVASAATVNLTTLAPNIPNINITGTTTITAFTVPADRVYFVRFAAALTLTNNASIVIPAGINIKTAAGDTCVLRSTAANTVEVMFYTPASVPRGAAKAWANVTQVAGSYTNNASFGISSVVRNSAGNLTITFSTAFSSANYAPQITAQDVDRTYTVTSLAANSFVLLIRSLAGAATDGGFTLSAFGDQ